MTTTASEQAQALVGRHYRATDHYEVGREKIREFARAVQDGHPAHRTESAAQDLGYDALIAPTTFASILWVLVQHNMFESVLTGYDISQILQTEQSIKLHRPITAGDRIQCDSVVESFRQFGDKDFMVVKNVLSNQHKELLQTAHTTVVAQTGAEVADAVEEAVDGVIMSGQSLAARSQAESCRDEPSIVECFDEVIPDNVVDETQSRTPRTIPAFEELTVGMELPVSEARVSRGDLVNYAGVSGDSNPIHFSDKVAAAVGLPDVVAHGLLTMGLGASYLSRWLGDPAAITEYGVRFAGFAPVPAAAHSGVEFRGRVKSLDAEQRSATIALTGTCAGRKLFGRATAVVQLR
ncbi:dehydratase [Nocardia callitridis]|uniref:Dehydratase n=2 Tax=Nocardia callitridis TaxID=648753 RepID=A0ABP9K429_9NOCA